MYLFDLPSFLFVTLIALSAAVSAKFGREAWPRISAVIIPGGILGMNIGVTQMFQQMDDPEKIWPAFFVATLTPTYACLVKIGITAMKPGRQGIIPSPPAGKLGETALGIFCIVILSAMLMGGPFTTFVDTASSGIVALSLVGIYGMKGATKRVGYLPAVTRILPVIGIVTLFVSNGLMWMNMDNPTAVGPYAAIGLMTLLYANLIWVGSVLIKPTRAQRNEDGFQWFTGICGFAGISLMVYLASQL
jgi:hypothetical protein